jgi:hypothetical protein|tara:strand:+ start:1255 stop:2061 length:807 start_codon:yes stop_codon:yes gene_type:complete
MGFKMNGSPAKMGSISGTAGHSSALKMRAEANAASALKQVDLENGKVEVPALEAKKKKEGEPYLSKEGNKMAGDKVWKKGQDKAKSSGRNLDTLVMLRGSQKKGSDEYNTTQNQINQALGSKKRHGAKSSTETKGKKTTSSKVVPGISESSSTTKNSKNMLTGGGKSVKKSTFEDDKGITTKKSKIKVNKEGEVTKTKKVIKSDWDKDNKVDKKTKIKVNVKKGTTKRVTKEDGRRTVVKTDAGGNKTTKSRRTIKGWLTGKGKKSEE